MTTSQGNGNDGGMTARERTDLIRLATERAKVLKGQADVYAAQLASDFEDQGLEPALVVQQDWTWKQAYREAREVITGALRKARALVDERCNELGIPEPFVRSSPAASPGSNAARTWSTSDGPSCAARPRRASRS